MRQYNMDDLLAELKKQIAAEKNQRQWAIKHKISQVHVHHVLTGQKGIGSKMARALGFRKKSHYIKDRYHEKYDEACSGVSDSTSEES